MKNKDIVYLEHPVSASDKAKYIKEGKRIIDIKYKPKEPVKPVKKAVKKAVKTEG